MGYLVAIPLVLCLVAWLSALFHFLLAVRHRREGQSFWSFGFDGMKAFNPDNFTPVGQKYQRRFVFSFGSVVVLMLLTAAAAAASL